MCEMRSRSSGRRPSFDGTEPGSEPIGAGDRGPAREDRRCLLTDLNIDFDFSVIGFETAEVDIILEHVADDADDNIPPSLDPNHQAISRGGDLWRAGQHCIYCGDALATNSYAALLGDERARLVFTDPPYNVRIRGHVGGAGGIQHREFAMASGAMTSDQFTSFLANAMKNLATYSLDGSLHYICMDWKHCQEILAEIKNPASPAMTRARER